MARVCLAFSFAERVHRTLPITCARLGAVLCFQLLDRRDANRYDDLPANWSKRMVSLGDGAKPFESEVLDAEDVNLGQCAKSINRQGMKPGKAG